MTNITFISASAGSGKTHRITGGIIDCLAKKSCRPSGLIATTFTTKAAGELRTRLRQRLYENGYPALAEQLDQGLIGTVHSVCGQLLQRFAFEAGISPRIEILPPEETAVLFSQAVEIAAEFGIIQNLQLIADRLGQKTAQTNEYTWKTQVRQIVEAVRSNDIASNTLGIMAEESIASLVSHLPEQAAKDLDAELRVAIQSAITSIQGNGDNTKTTQGYLRLITNTQRQLDDIRMPWSDWVKLGKEMPAAQSKDAAASVCEVASRVESHPRLRKDIGDYTRSIFSLASKSLDVFKALKEERGLLDYTDLEQYAFHLLRDQSCVREVLTQELDLLVVDEFQDTSPIQLAVFMQLATCAKNVIWVGDVKQAIFGFRNSDPDLIRSVVSGIKNNRGVLADPLCTSWRSSPELVRLVNAIFTPAFAESLAIPAAEVQLTPVPGRVSRTSVAVEFLELSSEEFTKDKKNSKLKQLTNEKYADTLAEAIDRLVKRNDRCQDKQTGKPRPIQLRDVAVLCRSNNATATVASALAQRGIPVTLAEKGLLATPEVRLALACVKRLADPSDTLAAAEIVALGEAQPPEVWLASRLEYVQQKQKQEPSTHGERWGLEPPFVHPALVAIEQARAHLKVFSPSEALDVVMLNADVSATVSAWGPDPVRSAQRRANLEALRALTSEYEQSCATTNIPATVAGFLFWSDDLRSAKRDTKAADEQANAIYVGTYHSAKGLEWPVVICSNLDWDCKPRLWEVVTRVQDQTKPFNLVQPLSNRFLHFWAWPFGKQETGIPLVDRIENSEAGRAARQTAKQEELRLLYVGLTRARDLLVLARDKSQPTPWLDILNASWLHSNETAVHLPDGSSVPVSTVLLTPPQTLNRPLATTEYAWWPAPVNLSEKLPLHLTPSGQPALPEARIRETVDFGARLPLAGSPAEADLGDALHSILAAELLNPNHADRLVMASRVLAGYEVKTAVQTGDVIAMADRFRAAIQQRFQPIQMLVEVPFTVTNEAGQWVTGIIDLLLETKAGWVIIDHKSFPGKRADWPAKALSYTGQLALYALALSQEKRPFMGAWIHFAVGGGLVEVLWDDQKSSSK